MGMVVGERQTTVTSAHRPMQDKHTVDRDAVGVDALVIRLDGHRTRCDPGVKRSEDRGAMRDVELPAMPGTAQNLARLLW